MHTLTSVNPSNYSVLGEVAVSTSQEIAEKVSLARAALPGWSALSIAERVSLLRRAFDEFKVRGEELALLESREMGMPIREAIADFDATLGFAAWYFDNAERCLSPETTFDNDKEIHQVFYEPIGVCAVIIPWNFPFANVVWGILQSLIAGNTVALKHSEECPLCGKFIEEVLTRHLPKGVLNEIYGNGETGKELAQQNIDMIAFTGSTKTGRFLYEVAGKKFIKAIMELGGSAPGIIFEDTDIDTTIERACALRLLNAGQCCDGLKRLIVHESVFDQVVDRLISLFSKKSVGNAEEESTDIGPLVAKRQLNLLTSQVEDATSKGAHVATGGNSLEKKLGGVFYEPTMLTSVTADMRVWQEEVFGPVLPIMKFNIEKEAIAFANQTMYGLGAYIFTEDREKAERVAHQIQSGMVGVNGANYVMPFNPFGGYKHSGFGREHGKYGFHEVTQIKVITRNK